MAEKIDIEVNITAEELENAVKNPVGKRTAQGGEIFNDYTYNEATSDYSSASGFNTKANAFAQSVMGKFNENKKDTLFEVGDGTDEQNRSNAFEVYKDGHAEVKVVGNSDNSIITKRYIDDEIDTIRHEVVTSNTLNELVNEFAEAYATKQYVEDYINEALGGEY
jgi:hypothetical protein